ncbi:uncharacterized protein LOC135470308 [Liolophura sinensis]|uniref:uncharacterized protein LOC135470308 n=1 Tax=Liolophura sinensis TaxID=3198878 RepID=UPI0031595017
MEGPKSRCTCYTVFQRKVHKKVLEQNPFLSFAEISKKIGEMWSALSVKEKKMYKVEARRINRQRNAGVSILRTELSSDNNPSSKQKPSSAKHPTATRYPSPVATPPQAPPTCKPEETTAEPSTVAAPFPVTLIRVDRTPQPMTYQFADKTDMLSMCNVDGAKLNVKVVYTCTPVNPQGKMKTSPVKKEAGMLSKAHSLQSILNHRVSAVPVTSVTPTIQQPVVARMEKDDDDIIPFNSEPDLSVVNSEALDDIMVIEDSIPSSNAISAIRRKKEEKAGGSYGDLSKETTSPSEMTSSGSCGQGVHCSSPLISSSPPLLRSVSPPSSAPRHQQNNSPPVLFLEPQLTQHEVSKTPANSITASSILKEKLASFVAAKRSFTDVDTMPTKLTIQGKSIVLSASNSQPPLAASKKEDDGKEINLCGLTTSSQPPVRVAFRPKKKGGERKKKEGDEVPVYTCNQCMIAFSQDIQLRAHFLSAHTEEDEGNSPQYRCHFCSIVFEQKHDLTAHMVVKHANKGVVSIKQKVPMAVPSEIAAQTTTTGQPQVVTQVHQKHQTKSPEYSVPIDATSKERESTAPLNRGPSPLTASAAEWCNVCGCVFPYKRSLDIHRLKEHVNIFSPTASVSLDRSETVKLEVEGKMGSTVQNVVHKTSFCLSCGYPCKSNSELGKHIYSKHGGKYFCPATGCKRVYQERRCLKLHINSHHPRFKAYSCKSCSFCTYQQLAMLRHLDDHAQKLKGNVTYVEKQRTSDFLQVEECVNGSEEVSSTEEAEETLSAPYVYIERFNGEEVEDVPFNPSPGQSLVAPAEETKSDNIQKLDSQGPSGFRCLDCKGSFSNRNSLTAHFNNCGLKLPSASQEKTEAWTTPAC